MRRSLAVGLVLCSMYHSGCASKSGDHSLQADSGAGLGRSANAKAPLNDSRYMDLVRKIEQNGGTAPLPEPPSTTAKIGSAVKKATTSVTGALALKPKVVKAADPVALSSMPDKINADVFYQAGQLAESKGNSATAIKQYTRALEVDARHLPSLISLARLHDRENKFTEAERLYRQAIEAEPENAMAYNDLGLCLARHDRDEEAIVALRHAVSLEPDRALYRNNLATVLVDLGRVQEAWNELSGAHAPAVAHYNLGYLLYEKGDRAQAREQLLLACQSDSGLTQAHDMLARLDDTAATPREKVRAHVQDAVAGTPDARTAITPVAMKNTAREMRRIPPTDSGFDETPSPPPAVRLQGPIPHPTPGTDSSSMMRSSRRSRLLSPVRAASVEMTEDVEPTDLPTPELLQEVAQHSP